VTDQRAKGRVTRGVTDEDAAEQRLRVVGDHQLRVRALDRIVQRDFQRALGPR
jgi:hypothetical protein